MPPESAAFIAFEADRSIASGDLPKVVRVVKTTLDRRKDASILIFDPLTGGPVDIDLRGQLADVLARLPSPAGTAGDAAISGGPRGPGRPKLGVVAREVTLLPRHWEWLAQQSGGASVALRRLVDQARRGTENKDRIRRAQEAAYRFISAMAGNRPNFEDAIRALFAGDSPRFRELIAGWPADIGNYASKLAEKAFDR